MATQIIQRTLCDFCQADGIERPDATSLTVSLNGDTYEIDVCPEHGAPLQALSETLAEHGRKIPTRAGRGGEPGRMPGTRRGSHASLAESDPDGRFPCPACSKSFATRGSLLAHTRGVHSKTLAELLGEPVPFACDECSKRFPNKQGLAVHKRWHEQDANLEAATL